MAGLRAAFRALRAADAVIRSRNRPDGALMALSAYLVGFALIRTAANSYLYFSSLHTLVPRTDAYTLAVLGATFACAPLSAALILSRSRPGDRRLSLLPVTKPTWMAVAALGPAITALPTILLASVLPAIAALPMAAWSIADYLKTATWFPVTAAALSLGLRSQVSTAAGISGIVEGNGTVRRSHGRAAALAGLLLACATANPSPSAKNGHAILSIFGTKYPLEPFGDFLATLPLPTEKGYLALLTLTGAALFAGFTAVAEEALLRNAKARSTGRQHRNRIFKLHTAWPMLAIADRKHDLALSLAVCLVFAMMTITQKASPSIPFVVAAMLLIIRTGSALAFMATESGTTRRFALIPAQSGAADRAYLGTALALAALQVAPLATAGTVLMGQ